jgi:hypothetical protein
MKTLTTLLALALFCATGYGQTIKSLGYNTTNGEVVANTGTNVLTFTNAIAAEAYKSTLANSASVFEIDEDGVEGFFVFSTTNITDGALILNILSNTTRIGSVLLGVRGDDAFIQSLSGVVRVEKSGGGLADLHADTIVLDSPAATRTNLGLGGGLTTNVVVDTNTLVFTNGILLEVQ